MPSHRPFARRALAALALGLLTFAAAPATAQVGPFTDVNGNWWLRNGADWGYSLNANIMFIDMDGNGTQDQHHPLGFSSAGWTFRLTPSRQFVYAIHAAIAPCATGATVRFYQVPPVDNAALTLLTEFCVPGGISQAGCFDQPASFTQRIAFVVDGTAPGTATRIHWVDLNTGAVADIAGFNPSIEHVGFSPSGIAGVVKHEANGDSYADWDFISLCAADLGTRLSTPAMQHLNLATGNVSAQVAANGAGLDAVLFYPNPATEVARLPISNCAPPPTLGACCLPLGGCLNGTTQAYCEALAGTWKGAGTVCATAGCPPPPAPDLHVTLAGPGSAQSATTVAYVLGYSNTGTASAGSVTLRNTLPTGATFVRASNGGFQNGPDAQWSLGTLAAGASGACSLYVNTPCNVSSMTNSTFSITGTPGGTVTGSPAVTTALSGYPTTALGLALATAAQSPQPLATGDKIRYTLTLTNTLGQPRTNTRFSAKAGKYSTMDAVVQAGGGTATINGDFLNWTGTLGPLASAQIVFDTRVTECRPPGSGIELLNAGLGIVPLTPCNNALGVLLPRDTVRLAPPPVAVSIAAPSLGSAQLSAGRNVIAARAGGPADFHVDVSNTAATPSTAVSVSLPIGSGLLPIGDPPFVGTPPAGTTWNAGTKTIQWQGTVPADDSVHVIFRASVDTTGTLMGSLTATGDVGPCFGALSYALDVVGMRPEPAEDHLLGLSRYEGVWSLRPGTDAVKQRLVGFNSSSQGGFTRTSRGDVWVVGTPSYRANPGTGEFEVLSAATLASLDADALFDVGYDAGDSTVVFAGYKSAKGLRVARLDPRTRAVTMLYVENNVVLGSADHVKVDPTGRIVLTSANRLAWIDPAVPNVATVWSDSANRLLPALAIDLDGNYLVIEQTLPLNQPGRILSVDRNTGVFTALLDIPSLQMYGTPLQSLAVATDGGLWAGFDYGSVLRFTRSPWAATTWVPFGYVDDLEWVRAGGSTAGVDSPPGEPPAGLGFAPPSPNPSTGRVRLSFTLASAGRARLTVFDLGGRCVRTIADAELAAGAHDWIWEGRDGDGRAARPGLYFVRLEAAGRRLTRRVVLAR